MNIGFNPRKMTPLDGHGVVYEEMRVTDEWGILTVTRQGALLSKNWDFVLVPARDVQFAEEQYTGDGWSLRLDPDWRLEQENGSYRVIRKE